VWWSSQMEFSITCNVVKNLTNLPFDQHTCPFIMGSYSDSDERVRVRWRRDSSNRSLAATALVNWDGACTAEWFPYMLTQGEVTYDYVTSTFTYATAQVAFVRSPSSWISTYLVPAVLLVAIAYLGFYIDPAAQPARIGLGITSVLVTVINLQSLLRALPATTEQPWLVRFVMTCLMFNVAALVEQTMVSYGLQASKWLKSEMDLMRGAFNWKRFLLQSAHEVTEVFKSFDKNNDGSIDHVEFRAGLALMGLHIDKKEADDLFDSMDENGSKTITFDELEGALNKVLSEMVPPKKTDKKKRTPGMTNTSRAMVSAGMPPLPQGQQRQEAVDDAAIIMTAAEENTMDTVSALWLKTNPPPPAAKSLWDRIFCVSNAAKVRRDYTKGMARDLGKDMQWHFKFFTLFPMVVLILSRLDHYARVVFPAIFLIVVLVSLDEQTFGAEQGRILDSIGCYQELTGS